MNSVSICVIMGPIDDKWSGCDGCGDYAKWQPCNENVPDHIPKEQVKKWLLARRPK